MNLHFYIQEKLHSTDVALVNTLMINAIQQNAAQTKGIPDADTICIGGILKASLRGDSMPVCFARQESPKAFS